MKNEEILTALRRLKVETGSLACMGCGREHDCGIHGCRIAREAAELIEKLTDRCARYAEEIAVLQEREKWVPVTERLPESAGDYLCWVKYYNMSTGNMEKNSESDILPRGAMYGAAMPCAERERRCSRGCRCRMGRRWSDGTTDI